MRRPRDDRSRPASSRAASIRRSSRWSESIAASARWRTRRTRAAFERAALAAVGRADAVLVSDYGSGLVTPALVSRLRATLKRDGHPIPVLVDSRYQLLQYRGLTACTPNESEVEQALGVRINDDMRVLERAGRAILEQTKMQAVLITRGSRGMALVRHRTRQPCTFPSTAPTRSPTSPEPATRSWRHCRWRSPPAPRSRRQRALANYAGGLVVMKRGTATVSPDELRNAVRADGDREAQGSRRRPGDRRNVARAHEPPERRGETWVRCWNASNSRCASPASDAPAGSVAFANGCFDLLHVGHVRYLEASAAGGRRAGRRVERRCQRQAAER